MTDQPIPDKSIMTSEIAGPTGLVGVRSVITGYPATGLNPARIGTIMRAADHGYPLPYFELAEQIEELDLHYAGVLGTRKRSVSQLEITVEAASESPEDVADADMVRAWLRRDALTDELFDMLDAVGKGMSYTEIIWDTSEGQWQPKALEWRDPRWFDFNKTDGTTPLLRSTLSESVALPPYKFIATRIRAKSGLPVRSGIARVAAWAYMFKNMTGKDWAIFSQNYGQPIRLGKYPVGASKEDREVLYQAVSAIAGDCAAIIPATMTLDFIESKLGSTSPDLYEKRSDWLNREISKLILGQTTTTDAVSGGHAVSQEHRQVQEDIERADGRAMGGVLTRDLVIPWIILEKGPRKAYPRIIIGRPEEADIALVVDSVTKLVPLGLRVSASQMRDLVGLSEPDPDEEVLSSPAGSQPQQTDIPIPPSLQVSRFAAGGNPTNGMGQLDAIDEGIQAILADQGWEPLIAPIIAGLSDKLATASSLEDVRTILAGHLATMDTTALQETLAKAGFSARIAGLANETLDPAK